MQMYDEGMDEHQMELDEADQMLQMEQDQYYQQ